jgi:hypothetical protein
MAKTAPWQNRIIGEGEESPDQLLANPANWRGHPKNQQDTLTDVLSTVGWVQKVIINKRTGFCVDGHLRIALAITHNQPTIPVTYVDLDDAEEALILATFDPISAMAFTDAQKLDELLRDVSTDSAAVQQMLSELAADANLYTSAEQWTDAFGGVPEGDKQPFQQMTFTLHDSQAETVKQALSSAGATGEFTDSPNANSNGNALARICEAFIKSHDR